MKKILALIFCLFLAGCASKPSVKNLNLKSNLNYGGEELAKILEQDDAVAFSSNLREGIFIYILPFSSRLCKQTKCEKPKS